MTVATKTVVVFSDFLVIVTWSEVEKELCMSLTPGQSAKPHVVFLTLGNKCFIISDKFSFGPNVLFVHNFLLFLAETFNTNSSVWLFFIYFGTNLPFSGRRKLCFWAKKITVLEILCFFTTFN